MESRQQALDLPKSDAMLGESLGRDFIRVFVASRPERAHAMQAVSQLEYDW